MPAQFSNPDPASASPPSTPFDSILAQCRDLVCERLNQALSGMLDKVDETLTASINESRDANAKKLYAKTRDKTLAQREAIEKQFSTRFLREFQRRSNRVKKIGDSFAEIDLSSLTLELVGEEDLDETLKFNAMAARLRQYCDEELIALDQRVGVLLGDAGLQAEDNPFTPQAICDAYKDTCRQLDPDVEVRMVLLKLFDDHVADAIRAVYKALNALLVQNSILPKIRISARKEPTRQPPPVAAAGEAPKAPAAAEPKAAEGEQDLFAILKNLRAGTLNAGPQAGGAPGGSAQGGASGTGAGMAGTAPVIQGSELLGLLTRIQLGDASSVAGTMLPVAAPGVDPGMANILRELKGSSVGSGMNQLDMMTLDIMSLVFDQLFDDPKIPVGAKGLIGRLQIPMLKVAIADKTFFSKKGHPARQLLDTLGEISLRLPADFNASSPLFKRMEVILQGLIDGFADKMEVFDVARAELEKLLNEENQRAEQEALSAAKQIEQKERLALAKTIAQAEIRARARTANVPLPVLEFLIQQWVQVLLIVHVVDGEDSDAWKTALETMDLLIWSVEPKTTADERHELKAIVPELLQGLVAGLKLVGAEEAIRSGFFTDLKNLHDEMLGEAQAEDTVELHGADEAATAAAPAAPADLEFDPASSAEPPVTPAEEAPVQSAAPASERAPAQAAQLAESTQAAEPAPVPEKEPAPSSTAQSAQMADLDFGAPAAEPRAAPAAKAAPGGAAPDAIPALIPDLDLDFAPEPVSESAAVPLEEPPAAVVDASATPVPGPAFSLDLEFTPEKTPSAPMPELVRGGAAAPAFLPDLEFEPLPVPSPVSTVAPLAPAAEPPPGTAAEPVFVLDLDFAPTLPLSAPPAAPAEFVSLPELPSRPEKAPEPTGLPDLNFAMPETSPAPVAKSDAARPASAPSAQPPAVPATRSTPAAGPQSPAAPQTPPASQRALAPGAQPAAARPAAATGAQAPASPSAAKPATAPQRAPAPAATQAAPAQRPAQSPQQRPQRPAAPGAKAAPPARPAAAAQAGQAPRPAARPASASPGAVQRSASSLDFTAPVTVKNPFGGGQVEVEDLDFTAKPPAGSGGAKSEASAAELPPNLKVGTWVGIRGKNDKEPRKSAKLSFISPLKTRFLFVDKQGKTTLDCTRADLARRFQTGEVVFMDKVPEVPLFDRLTEGLVGKLGGSKPAR